ncbi:hypothetical protein [Paraburkholderia solisilvae]|uniref:hypothetical protein n=1 Tax=Paraburkholderia solisilvae TaxID=624376 RepID=UPI0015837F9F|nr:hypothetical protein [Paraburkholderia solisilvae]
MPDRAPPRMSGVCYDRPRVLHLLRLATAAGVPALLADRLPASAGARISDADTAHDYA